MKISKSYLVIGLGLSLLGGMPARADLEVSAGISIHANADFYAPLSSGGAWVDVGTYGRCWRPSGVAVDWRPYCEGSWEWTDNGWYWQTSEPFGWACYHYGSWVYDPVRYWVWVPGVEWAPAWVSWRHGGGYVGWAPLGPGHVVVGGPQFVFVAENHFHEPVRRSAVVVNNTTIINKTVVINNVRQENRGSQKVVINEGPGLATMQKATGNKITKVSVTTAVQRTTMPKEVKRTTVENRTETKTTVNREPANRDVKFRAPNTPPPTQPEPVHPAVKNEPARNERIERERETTRPEPARPAPTRSEPVVSEPPVEHAPLHRSEPREELKRETKPAVVAPEEKRIPEERTPALPRVNPAAGKDRELPRVNPVESKDRELPAHRVVTHPEVKRPVAPAPHPAAPAHVAPPIEEKKPEKP